MTTPFFSIVVPTWNRGKLIEDTMHSLLNQDFPHSQYEIIVVDDGSTDDTLNQLGPFSSRIRIFQQQNLGAPTARNRGMQQAKGEYIVCFDHDDILFPYALTVYKRVIDAFERPPLLMASLGKVENLTPEKPSRVECVKCKDYFSKSVPMEIMNSVLILRKDNVLNAGGYSPDSGSYDDQDVLFKLGNASPIIKINQPKTVDYRYHDRNATRDPEFVTQGLLHMIRNERRGVYPGGGRRMLDRRGLIGTSVLWVCYFYHFTARQTPLHDRLSHIVRLLLHARGMILAAFVRRGFKHFYSKEFCSLVCPIPESVKT
jgi:glycosyltransferase involved in cell wall biosynthesis